MSRTARAALLAGTESLPERIFLHRCEISGLPTPQLQVKAIAGRRWRWDFGFWVDGRWVLVEINGGQWSGGRHNRPGAGYEGDLRKQNAAQIRGCVTLAFTPAMVDSGEAIDVLREVLER